MKMKKNALMKWRENYTPWATNRVVTEGLELNVHFDEKNWVKNIGGRWDNDRETWWIPRRELSKPVDSTFPYTIMSSVSNVDQVLGSTTNVLEWLDNNKMVNRAYGNVDVEMVQEACTNLTSTGNDIVSEYTMANNTNGYQSSPITIKIEWWHNLDCVRFTSDVPFRNFINNFNKVLPNMSSDGKMMWENSLKAKDIWEELINAGLSVSTHYSAKPAAITSP